MDIVDPVACRRGLYLPRLYVMLSGPADVADAIDECPLAVGWAHRRKYRRNQFILLQFTLVGGACLRYWTVVQSPHSALGEKEGMSVRTADLKLCPGAVDCVDQVVAIDWFHKIGIGARCNALLADFRFVVR